MKIVILSLMVAVCSAYKTGAPEEICKSGPDLKPQHADYKPSNDVAPYTIKASSLKYSPGENISVTIKGKDGEHIKGFAVAAEENGERIGSWQTTPGVSQQLNSCPVITHVNNDVKPIVTLTWKAPQKSGEVRFRTTIVQEGNIFWINQFASL